MSFCTNRKTSLDKQIPSSGKLPWIFEDPPAADGQLEAAYRNTRLEYETQLNINSNPKPAKLTGIMVTLGITNSHPSGIVDIVMAGANMVRLNASHGEDKWHAITIQSIRHAGNRIYRSMCDAYPLGVAMNLRGPEIRTGLFRGDKMSMGHAVLEEGKFVRLMTDDMMKRAGCACCFWVSYRELPKICRPGDRILIDRGAVLLKVTCLGDTFVVCKVVQAGIVRDEKLVQLLDSAVALPQVSEKDDTDIDLANNLECDFIIVNHARNAKMVHAVKNRIKQLGTHSNCVVAKISTQQGFENFNEILKAADGILLDRGGLEVDIKTEKLFLAEKFITAKCIMAGKPIVLGFRPCENVKSKIDLNLIANAVLNGVDAVFLATGNLKVKETADLVQQVSLVCREAECARWQKQLFGELSYKLPIPSDPCQSIAVAAVQASLNSDAAAIIVTTTTGHSAILLSFYRPRCPIIAVCRNGAVSRCLHIYFGVHPLYYRTPPLEDWSADMKARIQSGMDHLRRKNYIQVGDAIVLVSGWREGAGFTNSIRVIYASVGSPENQIPDFEPF